MTARHFGSTNKALSCFFTPETTDELGRVLGEACNLILSPLEQLALAGKDEEETGAYAYVRQHRPDLYRQVAEVGFVSHLASGDRLVAAARAENRAMEIVAQMLQEQEEDQ